MGDSFGMGGGSAGGSGEAAANGGKAPVTQVMDSILGMALQLPALKSIGDQIGVDLSGAVDVGGRKPPGRPGPPPADS